MKKLGGLILAAKTDECQLWEDYCKRAGRMKDLVVFGDGNRWKLDFVDYEYSRPGEGAGHTANLWDLIEHTQQLVERKRPGSQTTDAYWGEAKRQLGYGVIDLLSLGLGRVSVLDMDRVINSVPQTLEQVDDPKWQAASSCYRCIELGRERLPEMTEIERRDFEVTEDYFLNNFAALDPKTKSIVTSSMSAPISVFNRGIMRELFCTETNITPEDIGEHGLILVVGLAVKEYHHLGLYANVLWKYLFQRYVERRPDKSRGLFWWADEFHNFVTPDSDMSFLTTARSSRCASVLLTQSTSNLHKMLGQNSHAEAESLMACLGTKIFHANTGETNDWAAHIIGESMQWLSSPSTPTGPWGPCVPQGPHGHVSMSLQKLPQILPTEFTRLKKGGPLSQWECEALIFQGGRVWKSTGTTWMRVSFNQKG